MAKVDRGLEPVYQDQDGNPVSLDKLCRIEPAWAANRLRAEIARAEAAEARVAELEAERIHLVSLLRGVTDDGENATEIAHQVGCTLAAETENEKLRALLRELPMVCSMPLLCYCTHEQGDSDCAKHPTCYHCGEHLTDEGGTARVAGLAGEHAALIAAAIAARIREVVGDDPSDETGPEPLPCTCGPGQFCALHESEDDDAG